MTEIARALKAIGNRSVVRPLRDFLLTYRCEPEFRKAPAALNTVADALLEMGGEEERQLLQFVGNDSHTLQSLRVYVAAALRQAKKPSKKKQPQKKPIGKKPGARASSRTK